MYNFDKYLELGYDNREDYLNSLSLDYCIDSDVVINLANMLGEEEDFDGLIGALEEIQENEYFGAINDCDSDILEYDNLILIDDEPIF